MSYSIEEIAASIDARRVGTAPATIEWILTDSRSVCFPDETLFFALSSARADAHRYIPDLYERGVRNFVVKNLGDDMASRCVGANFLVVANPLRALQLLAAKHRSRFTIPVIGITGSNGKTIVKEWLNQVLSPSYSITRSPRSYNSQVGVPLSTWLLGPSSQLAIIEAGISEVGEMERLQPIIRPTIGVLTNIGSAHQENFLSAEQKCMEKLQLFRESELLIYNADESLIVQCVEQMGFAGHELAWSKSNPESTLYIKDVAKADEYTTIRYRYLGYDDEYSIPFIDDASVENSINVLAAALYLGTSSEQIRHGMAHLEPIAMRLEVKQGLSDCTLINDSYNSDVNSLSIALDFMNRRPDASGRSRTLILSDILQTGLTPDLLYRRVAQLIESRGIDKLIGIGPEISSCAECFSCEKHFFPSTKDFLQSSQMHELRSEVILIKGSRRFRFDLIADRLELKVHETILEVNLGAIVENLNYYRSFMKPETKMVCMVKASAYGSGSIEVAKTLQDHRVDYLAVAVADEGADLRRAGITANIIVMNPEMSAFKTIFDNRLEPEIYNFNLLEAFIAAAEREGITAWPVHIKLDTGMHRLGFNPETDMERLIARLQSQSAAMPKSVFSHFVGSDDDSFDEFSSRQFELFDQGSTKLQQAFSHHILRHICNSAGIEHFPERHLDMVRLGLGLYGINARNNHILHNVSTLKTTILQIRDVPSTDTVGYSRRGVLKRASRIAAIPIGYADGLNRHLGRGNGYCLVNGKKAPYVGNICMDVCMIDVTDIPCQEGDSVEIFGNNLPVTVLSDILDTIPYEILTGISTRVARVYYQD